VPDLTFQDLSTVQSPLQQKPVTLASSTVVSPSTFLSFISGTVAIATITPPVLAAHLLCFVFTTTTPVAFTTAGNVQKIVTPPSNQPVFLVYDPLTGKYFAGGTTAAAS